VENRTPTASSAFNGSIIDSDKEDLKVLPTAAGGEAVL